MTSSPAHPAVATWKPLLDVGEYDLRPALSPTEKAALVSLVYIREGHTRFRRWWPNGISRDVRRLTLPIEDALQVSQRCHSRIHSAVVRSLLHATCQLGAPFWVWSREEWLTVIRRSPRAHAERIRTVAYLVASQRDLHAVIPCFNRRHFAETVLGQQGVDETVDRFQHELMQWGYKSQGTVVDATVALCDLMLRCGSPRLEDITPEAMVVFYESGAPKDIRFGTRLVARVLTVLGILTEAPIALDIAGRPKQPTPLGQRSLGVPPEWASWCQRWLDHSTLGNKTREAYYYDLTKVGRWLADQHPDTTNPSLWTRSLAADFVAAVDRMRIGDWAHGAGTASFQKRIGLPLKARTKAGLLCVMRTFFRDCQEWEWIPTRFDPTRAFATPRSIYALIGPDPRVIADDIWAKLLWAGLNLTDDDLLHSPLTGNVAYPLALVRAAALLWLFAGLRANEIARLPVGCIRWQHQDGGAAATRPRADDAICLLDVPVNKTGTAFSKPVDRCVGEAVMAWECVRPKGQPQLIDSKTGDLVDYLFAYRGHRISIGFINDTIITVLCKKANLPVRDTRGAITSHRARSTIATQLYNAKDPMTLFELQAWLGHSSPASTQHYARITPTTLTKAYTDAGYFERNLRTIEVLIDRDAIQSGAAATGTPWQHFDLGHGYCTYNFFEQCPHRMACARCDFYVPKESTQAQLLEAKENLQRMLVEIPLTDDERAAVEDGDAAVDRLLGRLAGVPTPAGLAPPGIDPRSLSLTLPVVSLGPGHQRDPHR